MPKIEFEERAVAFIDVLGFKSIVENSLLSTDGSSLLEELITTLETSAPSLDKKVNSTVPKELIPKHISISDSIILSAPLTATKMSNYRGLSILVMRVIQLTHILLSKGYLLRGGISVGKVWHSRSNIVGPAYQEAYKIETKTGVPRVELSNTAKELWLKTEGKNNALCLEYKECFMVNGLHDYYIQDGTHGSAERTFKQYSDTIKNNIENIYENSVRYKWWWFGEFIESEIKRNKFIIHT